MSLDSVIEVAPAAAFRNFSAAGYTEVLPIRDTGFGLHFETLASAAARSLRSLDGSPSLPLELTDLGLVARQDDEPKPLAEFEKTHLVDRAIDDWKQAIQHALDEPLRKHRVPVPFHDIASVSAGFAEEKPPAPPKRRWLRPWRRSAMRDRRAQMQEYCTRRLEQHPPEARRADMDVPAEPLRDEAWADAFERLIVNVPWNEPMQVYCGVDGDRLLVAITGLTPEFPGAIRCELDKSAIRFTEIRPSDRRQKQYLTTTLLTVCELAYRTAPFSYVETVAFLHDHPAARLAVPAAAREIDLLRLALRWPEESTGLGDLLKFDLPPGAR